MPDIHLAFRFHGNFYHSYRGDSPDEVGFGKDIRIIRHILDTLDDLNASGVPVRGTWDFENAFSLGRLMPEHCPDLIERLQQRARHAGDEFELMSYNNGLVSAHTAREFEAAIRRGISNAEGSGVRDLFGPVTGGGGFRPIVRPQEMIFTPVHLRLYRACGLDAISLYYSALPFNGFSNFVPPLSFAQRYNPLTLTYAGIDETLTLLPCYNVGDLADHLTLRRWVKQMRRQQLALPEPLDAFLLIDMDADDEFWVGFDIPFLKGRLSTASGLRGLVENVADLDFVRWTTPGAYLDGHEAVGSISIGQDTADGSFDGYASWAEKWSNHRLWTGLERARILELQARRLLTAETPDAVRALLDESFEARLELLSTTHFGMAAPVMNLAREAAARDLTSRAVAAAADALGRVLPEPATRRFSLLDYVRGASNELVAYEARPSAMLARLPLREDAPPQFSVRDATGRGVPSAILPRAGGRDVLFVARFQAGERKDYVVDPGAPPAPAAAPVAATDGALQNESLKLEFDARGQAAQLWFHGQACALDGLLRSGLVYAGERNEVETWTNESLALGVIGVRRGRGEVLLKGGFIALFEREIVLAADLPYLFVSMRVSLPRTPDHGYNKAKAVRLQQAWDARWQELRPCEIRPALEGCAGQPLRVWKHNHCDHISRYDLDYGRFSKNEQLDSVNNHITHGWVAVSDGEHGVLVAQTADVASGMAFCPLRTRKQAGAHRVRLNPFGTYWGKQYRYGTADTGLGNFLATAFSASDHIQPYAPSYNGRIHEFSFLLAPYVGDQPPEELRAAAEAFAYPYLVLADEQVIAAPAHRRWDGLR